MTHNDELVKLIDDILHEMQRIVIYNRLSNEYENDARNVWPGRWLALTVWLEAIRRK